MVIPSVSTVIHAYSLLHLYNQLSDLRSRLCDEKACTKAKVSDRTLWISCVIIAETADVLDLYETFISILQTSLLNMTITRAIMHIVDTATYIGWIYDTKYAVNVHSKLFSNIKHYLYLNEDDSLIMEADAIRIAPSYITKLTLIYDLRTDVYPNSFISNSQLSILKELYIRLRGYSETSITNIVHDILSKDLYQMTALVLPFSLEQAQQLLEKWPITTIGISDSYINNSAVIEQLNKLVHVVVCTYDKNRPSGMLSDTLYNMHVPHNADIMYH